MREPCAARGSVASSAPEDESPAGGMNLLGRVDAWLKQPAHMTPAGNSFFVSEQREPLPAHFLCSPQSARNPQTNPSSGQKTTAEGEADIPTF
jgi:hypothetical protein